MRQRQEVLCDFYQVPGQSRLHGESLFGRCGAEVQVNQQNVLNKRYAFTRINMLSTNTKPTLQVILVLPHKAKSWMETVSICGTGAEAGK